MCLLETMKVSLPSIGMETWAYGGDDAKGWRVPDRTGYVAYPFEESAQGHRSAIADRLQK